MRRKHLAIIFCLIWVLPWLVSASAVAGQFETMMDSFGNLVTVAGRGDYGDKWVNGWTASMEGGPAIDAELSRPHITMADAAGNLYIADKGASAIRKVTPDGTIHTVAGTGTAGFNGDGLGTAAQLNYPNGLYTLSDGTTYILDLYNGRIRRLATDGNLTTVIEDPSGISIGRGLWVSPSEDLIYYASGSLVRKWTPTAGLATYAAGFVELGNLDVDPTDDRLVVTDRKGHAVWKIASDGTKERIAGTGNTYGGGDGYLATQTGLNQVRGIAFAPDGAYYLATHKGGQVWYVDNDGIIHLMIDGDTDDTHAGDGLPLSSPPAKRISEPRAVTLAPNGDLIVTENDYGYVRIVQSVQSVPEPASLALATMALAGMFCLLRRLPWSLRLPL